MKDADISSGDKPAEVSFKREYLGAETPHWQVIESERIADCRVFQVRRDRSLDPRTEREHNFYCIESSDWINILPLTADNKVVMVEQYRHGSNDVTLEIPGGMIDPGESPLEAATRELLEETGYAAREVVMLGKSRPNPAIQNNWLHCFLARDAVFKSTPIFDGTEHIAIRHVPLDAAAMLIADGVITHALTIVCFYLLSNYQTMCRTHQDTDDPPE